MKNQTFWGIVGGIVLLWLILMGVVVFPKWNTYGEKQGKVAAAAKKLKKFSAMPADEIPTDDLLDRKKRQIENFRTNNQAARDWYQSRDEAFENLQGQSALGNWKNAVYSDGFGKLAERYRQHSGLGEEERLPFAEFKNLNDQSELVTYQKMWQIKRRVLSAAIDHGALIESYSHENKADANRAMDLEEFQSLQATVVLALPPSKIEAYLNQLLNDEVVNFSISDFAFTKDKKALKYDLVEAATSGSGSAEEPRVMARIRFDVQDWNPKPVEDAPSDDDDDDDEDQ